MTFDDDDTDPAVSAAAERIADILGFYKQLRQLLQQAMADEETTLEFGPRKVLSKIGEIQTVHTMVLRAEETFNDHIQNGTTPDANDLGAIRAEIGRRLDRLRAEIADGRIS